MVRARFVPVGPVSCGLRAWSSRGQAFATVIVKASFTVAAGTSGRELALADDPDPIIDRDAYHANNPTRSLSDASDLAPYLGRGEVHYRGSGFGPPGARVRARLAVKRAHEVLIDKSLELRVPAEGRLPIIYENALGGPEITANPVGRGDPVILDARSPEAPVGLGPLSGHWRARADLLAPGQRAQMDAAVLVMHEGVSWDYFHAAPPDQRAPGFFHGDETIVLEQLASLGTLELHLPGALAEARMLRPGVPPQPIQLAADLLRVDGDRGRVSLTWRGHVAVADKERIVVTAGVGLAGRAVVWPHVDLSNDVDMSAGWAALSSMNLASTAGQNLADLVAPSLPFVESSRDRSIRAGAAQLQVPWRDPGPHQVTPPPSGLEHTVEDGPPPVSTPAPIPAPPPKVAVRDHPATRNPRTMAIPAIPESPVMAAPRPEAGSALVTALHTAGASSDDIAALVSALADPQR